MHATLYTNRYSFIRHCIFIVSVKSGPGPRADPAARWTPSSPAEKVERDVSISPFADPTCPQHQQDAQYHTRHSTTALL